MVLTALLFVVPAGNSGAVQPVSAAGLPSISIVGNHFVDGNGATIRLLGVNRSGSEYMCTGGGANVFDGPSDDASVTAMAAWHINAVRLGLNEDCWLGINGFPNSMTASAYQTGIVNYVNLLHAHGLYAILELHWNAPGSTPSTGQQVMVDADHGPTFWTSVATTFKADTRVLFDLYNEPQGISWACLRDGCMQGFQTVGMQSLVNTVRATGATNPILVGGIGYAGDVSQWLAFRPIDSQVAASFHTYDFVGNCNSLSCTATLLGIAATAPVVTGELGETDCGHSYIDSYMPWADAHGISYLGWAWNTYDCTFPGLISAFDGTPSATFGQGFHDHLAALAGNPAATVTMVAPNNGLAAGGTAVTITGTNFTGVTGVQFGATAAASFSVNSATSISATSPAGTGTVDVRVTTAAGTSGSSSADQFTYAGPPPPAPTVSAVAPTTGSTAGGTPVTITGTNFTGATSVMFGGASASFTVTNATHVAATSPAGSGTVHVTVTTAGGTSATSSADQFTYAVPPPPAPTVSAVAPNTGPAAGSTPVTITGTNFTGATAVMFGGASATTFAVTNATHIAATSPPGSGLVNVTVTTAGGTSATSSADQFTYAGPPPPAPTVSSVAPSTGPGAGGTPVTITGTNLAGATAVMFGSTTSTYTVNSATQISATSPAGSGLIDVTVTTAGGTSATGAADQFTYIPRPTVGSVAPNTGPAAGGTPVTITGTNFTAATSVMFGGATASFTISSATQIATTSPAGSGTVHVTVTTPGGTSATSSADQFGYVTPPPPAPTVSAVTPNGGPAAGGTPVTITGTNFTGASMVMFGGASASFTVTNATHIAASSPAGSGTVHVTVTTAGGTSATSSADQFTYAVPPPPVPTVSGVAPNTGQATGGTSVTIIGTNFTGATAVTFGGTTATFTVSSATQIMATSPAHASAAVDVTVTTPGGTSALTLGDLFTFGFVSLGGSVTTAGGPSSCASNNVNVYVLGGDGVPWYKHWNGTSFSPWTLVGGNVMNTPSSVCDPGTSTTHLFTEGVNYRLYDRIWNGTTFAPWEDLGGSLGSGPASTSCDGSLRVVVLNTDGTVFWNTFTSGWGGWTSIGGHVMANPAVACEQGAPSNIDLFVEGVDRQLYHKVWNGTSRTWGAWENLNGSLSSSPAVVSCSFGSLDVFVLGGDGVMWRKHWNGSSWSAWLRIGGNWTSDPGAVCQPGTTKIDVFARGGDGALWWTELPN